MTDDIDQPAGRSKLRWIFESGWKGLCPRCGTGRMFRSWLKVTDQCDVCGLDYRFASPDDGPAFFSLCFVAFPLTFLIVWFQVAVSPPWWVHLLTSLPLMALGCVLPLRPFKGWLVASQYLNKAQEAGTEKLWNTMHGMKGNGEVSDRTGRSSLENASDRRDLPHD